MNDTNTSRHGWSWRSCFAVVKHKKKVKRELQNQSNPEKVISNGSTHQKQLQATVDENSNLLHSSDSAKYLSSEPDDYNPTRMPTSCIIKIVAPTDENVDIFIDEDSIEQINADEMNSSAMNVNSSSILRPTHLDAIVEDANEENSDDLDETLQPIKLCCDREIITDANDLHSRLFDLSKMNHVVTQFHENGSLLGDFIRQIEKLKLKTDDVTRASAQMPRDAELLEARYSTLLATIESLSLLLKISQIPASRPLINRLVFSIDQRTDQLTKLVQLTSTALHQRRDYNDDDFLSFRSALSSYEHLFPMSS